MRRGGTPFQPQFAFLAFARRAAVSCQSSSGTMRRCGASVRCHQTGQQITRRNLNIQPTLTIRSGFPVRVIVNRDLVLEPYRG